MLATVLAAVAAGAGAETSGTSSRFVSVKSSFEGVISVACSEGAKSEAGGVFGTSEVWTIGGGGSPGISVSEGIDVAVIGGSTGGSWRGAARGALGGAGAGGGLLNMLAQLRLPSGFELGFTVGFGSSAACAGAASPAVMCSQEESSGVLSATAESQPPLATSSVLGVLSHPVASAAGASSVLGADVAREPFVNPPLPPRPPPRPRSEPRPRLPRVLSAPPLPRPPRVDWAGASLEAVAVSLAFD